MCGVMLRCRYMSCLYSKSRDLIPAESWRMRFDCFPTWNARSYVDTIACQYVLAKLAHSFLIYVMCTVSRNLFGNVIIVVIEWVLAAPY